jgi:hypothetical protein
LKSLRTAATVDFEAMKAKAQEVTSAEAKQIAEKLVKEWHASLAGKKRASLAKKKSPDAVSRKMTATGRGLVRFHGMRVLEKYGAPVASRATTRRGSESD